MAKATTRRLALPFPKNPDSEAKAPRTSQNFYVEDYLWSAAAERL